MARPSGSRSVGTPATSTGRSRSRTQRRTTASCCASFSPRNSTSGCTTPSSLVTMTATPSKWLGREAPSKLSVSRPPTWTPVAKPSGYISSGVRREARPRRRPPPGGAGRGPRRAGTSRSPRRRPNCVGLTKTEAATLAQRPFAAASTRLRCPACSAPMVGTKPRGRGSARSAARASAMVRATITAGLPPSGCRSRARRPPGRRGRRLRRRLPRPRAAPAGSRPARRRAAAPPV